MKAALTVGERTIEYGDTPNPVPSRPGDILLEVDYAGICGSDLHVYRGEFAGRVSFPTIQGHEFAGTVVETGPGVSELKKGDRVCVDPIIHCGRCPACLAGFYNACRSLKLIGIDLNGAFARYVVAGQDQCFRVPDQVSDSHAAMVELYSIGMHATTVSRIDPGDTVVVLGAGRVGLAVLENLLLTAAGRVASTDIDPDKLRIAGKLGAAATFNCREVDLVEAVNDWTGGLGADCVVECIGEADLEVAGGLAPVAQAAQIVRSAGRITILGQGPHSYGVHWKTLVWKEAVVRASRVSRGEFPRVVAAMAAGKYHPDLLISGEYPLERTGEAFALLDSEPPKTVKLLIKVK
ncbi:MAG: alcohol dehydrogenase catalytic domain-containing protein [Candidatus Glassbacteria bacterium]|nr:alcohol dehydrogenase catalytic domain-containing protein [Candidatus Glassbacteria bacterium]